MTMERTVRVELGPQSYDVHIAPGALAELGATVAALGSATGAVVITDSNVGPLYGARAVESLRAASLAASVIEFPAGEVNKTLATVDSLLDDLLAVAPPIDRNTVIVALGGGVVGDVAGLVAAIALRGLRVVQCPTSLLACVDSSVGGKTGVDHATGKNLIGAFHQPGAVVVDVETLTTLPREELCNGLAESVKHGAIRDAALLDFIEAHVADILDCDAESMCELIGRNVAIKAAVVADDEKETGNRAHLNFGHTIGHAIEVCVGYDAIRHGEAVSLGMIAANRLAVSRGLMASADANRIERVLVSLSLPVRRGGLDADEIWAICQHDKKARGGKVRMVLVGALETVAIHDDITAADVAMALGALGEE